MATVTICAPDGLPYIPNPAQAKFHGSPALFRSLLGGIGSGKTLSNCMEGLATALAYPGSKGLIGRWSYKELIETTWDTLLAITPPPLIKRCLTSPQNLSLELWNGSKILGWNLQNWKNLTSLNLDWGAIDEGTELPDQNVWDQLDGRLRGHVGPHKLWLTGTPAGTDWVWKLFVKQGGPEYELVKCATRMNMAHLPVGFEEQRRRNKSADWIAQFLEAEFVQFEGMVFHQWHEAAHVIEPFEIPESWPKYRAIDPGLMDPTACLWLTLDERGHVYAYREYYETGRTVSENAAAIARLSGEERYQWTVIDPAANRRSAHVTGKNEMDLWRDAGIDGLQTGNRDMDASIALIQEFLRVDPERPHPITGKPGSPRFFAFRGLVHFREEVGAHRYGPNGKPKDGNDHLIACCRYGLMRRPHEAEGPKPRQPNRLWQKFWDAIATEASDSLPLIGAAN